MTDGGDARLVVAAASIREDARFIMRTANASQRSSAEQRPVMSLMLLPSFALITHESRQWLQHHDPDVAQRFPSGEIDRVGTIRHAAKWLGVSKQGVTAGLDTFRQMRRNHAEQFLGNTPYLWARALESDLGLYRHDGVDVLNTHQLGLVLGIQPLDELGPLIRTATETMVRQANLLTSRIVDGPSFLDRIGVISDCDVISDQYYRTSHREDLAVAGYLHVLWCSLAWLRLLQVADPDDAGTVFKLRFAGLFHVTQSLKLLEPDLIADIGEFGDGNVARRLRNELVHYTPHDQTPPEALQPQRPKQGLVEHAYGQEMGVVAEQLAMTIDRLHAKLGASLRHE